MYQKIKAEKQPGTAVWSCVNPIKVEITNARFDHNRKVITATVFAELSYDAIAYVNVYIGTDRRLRIDGFHENRAAVDTGSFLQQATFLVTWEARLISMIEGCAEL